MGNVVQFKKAMSVNTDYIQNSGFIRSMRFESCKSPIVVDRESMHSISIAFHKSYFNIPLLENAIQGLAYGESWDLYKDENEKPSIYSTYYILFCENNECDFDMLIATTISRITKKIYLEEISIWGNEIEIADLIEPRKYLPTERANITPKTKSKLFLAGIRTIYSLIDKTREDLCKIPEMTTEEIVRLEKSLASRGLFLKTNVPSLS